MSYLLSHTSLQSVRPPVLRYWVWSVCDLEALEEKLRLNVDQEVACSGLREGVSASSTPDYYPSAFLKASRVALGRVLNFCSVLGHFSAASCILTMGYCCDLAETVCQNLGT